MGSKKPPPAPNYTGAAEATAKGAIQNTEQQTWANRPNQYTPFGATTWQNTPTWDPSTGQWINQWSQNTSLAPDLQAAAESQMAVAKGRSQMGQDLLAGASQQVLAGYPDLTNVSQWGSTPTGGNISTGFQNQGPAMPTSVPQAGQLKTSIAGAGPIQTDVGTQNRFQNQGPSMGGPIDPLTGNVNTNWQGLGQGEQARSAVTDAVYQQAASRLDPQWQKQMEQTRTQLYNMGLKEGDAAFEQQMEVLNRNRNDAYNQAMYQAIQQGIGAQQAQFGMNLGGAQFGNQAVGQQFNQALGAGQFQQGLNQQGYNQALGEAGFYNQANLAQAQLRNAAQAQQFGQNAAQQAAYNQALQSQFGMGLQGNAQQAALNQQGFGQAQAQAAFGNQAAAQQLQQQQAISAYQNQMRQAQLAEQMQTQGWNLNLINAALAGQQVGLPGMPGVSQAGVAAPPNYLGAAQMQGQYGLDAYSAQQAQNNSVLSGIGSLVGAAAGAIPFAFSDERLKTKIIRYDSVCLYPGVPLATWEWKGQPGYRVAGVIAQDMAKANPRYVRVHRNGYLMVDYSFLSLPRTN